MTTGRLWTEDESLAAHYENTILITEGEPEILDTHEIEVPGWKDMVFGMMARSLAGHDKGKVYMILDVKEPFVYLGGRKAPDTGSSEKEKDQTCSD